MIPKFVGEAKRPSLWDWFTPQGDLKPNYIHTNRKAIWDRSKEE